MQDTRRQDTRTQCNKTVDEVAQTLSFSARSQGCSFKAVLEDQRLELWQAHAWVQAHPCG